METSPDGKYVNLNIYTAKQTNEIFQMAKSIGISKEDVIDPQFQNSLFEEGEPQYIHLKNSQYDGQFFFRKDTIDRIKKHFKITTDE